MTHRIAAIIRADFLIRFRRPSTAVIFVLLSGVAYLWVPDPSTGRALLQIAGARALYNSAAIGMATASIATIFIGLVGFYVVSNAIRRDVESRCGFVIASTTMRRGEYLIGKLAGNVVFLSVFIGGFMLASMAMLVVRGEAPLQPLVFAEQYLYLVPSAIVMVSVLAIVFECVPLLSGKFGDVVYFFLWVGSLGVVVTLIERGASSSVARWFDYSGFAFLLEQTRAITGSDGISIGASSFDPSKPPFVFRGLRPGAGWMAARVGACLTPLPLLLIAWLFFHRFDPARLRRLAEKGRRNWVGRVSSLFKPAARAVWAILPATEGRPSLARNAAADALMTVTALPLAVAGAIGVAVASLLAGKTSLMEGVLPVALAVLAIFLSDVPCRDGRSGTLGLVHAVPRLQPMYVWWKFASAILFSLMFLAVPIVRSAIAIPGALPQLLTGIAFVCAAAVALGVISGNPKTFIVVFLTFWYLMMNDGTHPPALDFAGLFRTATPSVSAAYALCGAALLFAAQAMHSYRLRAE